MVQSTEFQETYRDMITQLQIQPQGDLSQVGKQITTAEFYKVAKDSVAGPRAQEDFAYKFIKKSMEHSETAMPIFTKINAGVLQMIGYRLSPGQATALATFIQERIENRITSLTLHDNCLREKEFALLMKGLAE